MKSRRYSTLCKCMSLIGMVLLAFAGCGHGPDGMRPPKGFDNQSAKTISLEEVDRLDVSDMFSDRDGRSDYDEGEAVMISLEGSRASGSSDAVRIGDGRITIVQEGTYVLSGSMQNGSVVVDAADTDKVQLVLKNVDITCDSTAAIYVKQADKVFITLAENTENKLEVTGEFVNWDDNDVDAVLFAKADISINGNGALQIKAPKGHGIVTKDDLVIMGGNYTVDAGKKALNGKDSVRIANGNFVLKAGSDGIYSEHDEDYEKGFVYIENGKFTINAVGDGIHAGAQNVIAGGTIEIAECEEGLEGSWVDIRGGNITLTATDDGINASIPEQFESLADSIKPYICIAEGTVDVTAYGDGIDANGNLYIFDGNICISGPENKDNGSIDYDAVGQITGGVVVAAGHGGMAQNFGQASTQGAMVVHLEKEQKAGTEIVLQNQSGEVLVSFRAKADYNCVIISCPQLKQGENYTLTAGTERQEIEMTELLQGGEMPGGMPEGMPGGMPGGMPEGMPEGMPPGPRT